MALCSPFMPFRECESENALASVDGVAHVIGEDDDDVEALCSVIQPRIPANVLGR